MKGRVPITVLAMLFVMGFASGISTLHNDGNLTGGNWVNAVRHNGSFTYDQLVSFPVDCGATEASFGSTSAAYQCKDIFSAPGYGAMSACQTDAESGLAGGANQGTAVLRLRPCTVGQILTNSTGGWVCSDDTIDLRSNASDQDGRIILLEGKNAVNQSDTDPLYVNVDGDSMTSDLNMQTNNLLNINRSEIKYIRYSVDGVSLASQEGDCYWDFTEHTKSCVNDISGTSLQDGQEFWVRVKADANLDNGEVVYITGVQGDVFTADLAIANDISKSNILGVATSDITSGNEGWVTVIGKVRSLNTVGFDENTTIYLSAHVAGAWNQTAPWDPYNTVSVVKIGTMGRIHSSTGFITVSNEKIAPTNTVTILRLGVLNNMTVADSIELDSDVVWNQTINDILYLLASGETRNIESIANLTGQYLFGDLSFATGSSTGLLKFYMNESSEGVPILNPDGLQMLDFPPPQTKQTITSGALAVGNHILANFTTPSSVPFITRILLGSWECDVHASKSSSVRVVSLGCDIFKVNASGSDVAFLGRTSFVDVPLTDSEEHVDLHGTFPDNIILNQTDRIMVQLFANVTGGGSNPTVSLFTAGGTDSAVSLGTSADQIAYNAGYGLNLVNRLFSVDNATIASKVYVDLNASDQDGRIITLEAAGGDITALLFPEEGGLDSSLNVSSGIGIAQLRECSVGEILKNETGGWVCGTDDDSGGVPRIPYWIDAGSMITSNTSINSGDVNVSNELTVTSGKVIAPAILNLSSPGDVYVDAGDDYFVDVKGSNYNIKTAVGVVSQELHSGDGDVFLQMRSDADGTSRNNYFFMDDTAPRGWEMVSDNADAESLSPQSDSVWDLGLTGQVYDNVWTDNIKSDGDIVIDPSGNNVLPGSNDTDSIGSAAIRWQNGYFTNAIDVGDIIFNNDFRTVEAEKLTNGKISGIVWLNPNGEALMYLNPSGDLKVKGTITEGWSGIPYNFTFDEHGGVYFDDKVVKYPTMDNKMHYDYIDDKEEVNSNQYFNSPVKPVITVTTTTTTTSSTLRIPPGSYPRYCPEGTIANHTLEECVFI